MIREGERETLLELLSSQQSVLVHGEPGVGKSWLVREVCAELDDSWHIERFAGTAAVADIAFCASAHLLPDAPVAAEPALVATLIGTLRARCGSKRLLLAVDDLNRIDGGTIALIHQLVSHGTTMIATVRTTELEASAVEPVWKDGWAERVQVDNISGDDFGGLVTSLLGRPTPALQNALWRLSEGNPLVTTELLRGATAQSLVREGDDGWELVGELPVPRAAAERINERRESYDEPTRRALDIVAIAEPVNRSLARRWGIEPSLAELERDGLTISEAGVDGIIVRCAHPLIGDAARAEVTPLRRATLSSELVAEVDLTDPALGRLDVLRLVRFALDGGVETSVDVRTRAAAEAFGTFDIPTALRLIDSIDMADRSFSTHMLAGRCHTLARDLEAATTALESAERASTTDVEQAMAIAARAELSIFAAGDFDGARDILRTALTTTTDPTARGELGGPLALAAAISGDFGPALELGDELLDSGDLRPAAELSLLVMNTLAQSMVGPTESVRSRIARGQELVPDLRGVNPVAETQLGLNALFVDLAELRLHEAIDEGRTSLAAAAHAGHPTAEWRMLLAVYLAEHGTLDEALDFAVEATREIAVFDPFSIAAMVRSATGFVMALAGDLDGAAAAIAAAAALPGVDEPRARVWHDRTAAVIAARADVDAAAAVALAGVDRATGGRHLIWGSLLAHDALGYGIDMAAHLEAINRHANNAPLTRAFADHARARTIGDLAGIDAAAERLQTGGLLVAALDARIAATHLDPDPVSQARRTIALHRQATELAGPLPDRVTLPEHPLSERELAVATAASGGGSSKAIAEELFVSARTIDNHLGRIYQKLGVNGRDELGAALRGDEPTAAD